MEIFVVVLAVIGGMTTIGAVVGAVATLCEMHEDLQINRAEHEKLNEEISQLRRETETMKERNAMEAMRKPPAND